jgi:hypothetical protein
MTVTLKFYRPLVLVGERFDLEVRAECEIFTLIRGNEINLCDHFDLSVSLVGQKAI